MPPVNFLLKIACNLYNGVVAAPPGPKLSLSRTDELGQVEEYARTRQTDISDHLVTLFSEAAAVRPRLIVELGTRDGESTFALERAARLFDAYLLSVDIADCAFKSAYVKWSFVKQDDVVFADEFSVWCSSRHLAPRIDVLFIDTSHLYEHTRQELRVWMPFLSPRGKMILHDTNMKRIYRRTDRSLGIGWNNARGVIRALEEELGTQFDESRDFLSTAKGWNVKHCASCNGLTVVERP